MARAFRYRASYKPSEVVGLFVLSLVSSMAFCAFVVYLGTLLERLLG
jgi:hypothetical protein